MREHRSSNREWASVMGGFEKDKVLALVFAEKTARKGLATEEFALRSYVEEGFGQERDLELAVRWYIRSTQDNIDVTDRFTALSSPTTTAHSRQGHDTITEAQLIRRRTPSESAMGAEDVPEYATARHGGENGAGSGSDC
ncbi:hypothetical protein BJ165DRAFT_1534670 [Panaeolus papilionaceus]|nr:hypothetical protein BJ165DRAFT_1534670 [Panaeolus papilionaceus]